MPIFIFTKERRIYDKTKRIATEKERRKIMGQRSQIFVRFEKNPGEKEIVARYYKWNCGNQMISIVYHTIEWLKKHLDLNNCGSGQYLFLNYFI